MNVALHLHSWMSAVYLSHLHSAWNSGGTVLLSHAPHTFMVLRTTSVHKYNPHHTRTSEHSHNKGREVAESVLALALPIPDPTLLPLTSQCP